jgi:hypothetical protein
LEQSPPGHDGEAPTPVWRQGEAQRLDVSTPSGDLPGMEAIYLIILFIAAIAVLNRIEFGRFD